MNIADIVAPERVRLADDVQSKKRALEQLAEILTQGTPYLTASEIFNGLISREKLGSTGIGDGVAIPHARMKGTDDCIGAFMRLPQPVNFESNDEQPVDLVFGLLVPEKSTEEHLNLLRKLAEIFSENQALAELRDAPDNETLHKLLVARDVSDA
ncbi:PTS IIA-like nitrogen-regulatory protein PtsN [Salinisphaera dokdonensis CL-ES53]|uniref:PTS IIA-like nitrogen-regulatory protein PtsN n=1 Tax=Salinisphaera dokdonensis CL-ES53 TaxID=1304272 RepID=A0ABV2AXE6_9GAMM